MNAKTTFYADRNHRPAVLQPLLDAIPAELRALDRWVLWRLTWKASSKSGKWDKPPFQPDGNPAKSNDPTTWTSFEKVAKAYWFGDSGGFDGVGFMLGDGFVGIDLDNVRKPDTGEITPEATELVEQFKTSTDVSPSGLGVKLIGRGEWRANWHKKRYPGDSEIEVYDRGRFFTVTGRSVGTYHIADVQEPLDRLAARFADRGKPGGGSCDKSAKQTSRSSRGSSGSAGVEDDDELIRRAMEAKNGAKFRGLWNGDTSGYGSDESRADPAQCEMLAFWCGPDANRIDRLFRRSKLMRDKWDEARGERTYGERTIATALEGKAEFYSPDPKVKVGATPSSNGVHESPPPGGSPPSGEAAPDSSSSVSIITAYFRERYRPDFRRGNAIHTEAGEIIPMGTACEVANSVLINRLAFASDAPRFKGGGVDRDKLPGTFKKWSRVAWGDLLDSLPDEDTATLASSSSAADEFRRLVREAMLSEVTIGDILGQEGVTRTERRSLIDWCEKWAKPGPWRSIRSKKCWCKIETLGGGEIRLKVAIRHELFAQLNADRRLLEMGANTFTRRASKYGVGKSPRDDRPHGQRALILADDFVADLTDGLSVEEGADDAPEI